MSTLLLKDGYKVGHIKQYPADTRMVYSNLTARGSRIKGIDEVVFFGLQGLTIKYLIENFQKTFFSVDRSTAVNDYKQIIDAYLGEGAVGYDHIGKLHDLGYLPIEIMALPEGTRVPLRVPMFTIRNTHEGFGWLTNMLETLISCSIWGPCTSATLADRIKSMLLKWAIATGSSKEFVQFQAHDFSMRGMNGLEAAEMSGGAHLTSFNGTDTIPAILWLIKYYDAKESGELIGASVAATEHSVMCMGGKETEEETYLRLINDIYPSGIVSIVSDTWDFWKVVTKTLPNIKEHIMNRDGKLVIRPDSGDPIKIICGDPDASTEHEKDGLIKVLYETFPGGKTSNGYKLLDTHIGAIYGDAITYDVANTILDRLSQKNFASENIVFGIGAYTYQYNTRDTFGFAMKATAGVIEDEEVAIFKDPKTDNGLKKSAKGFLRVERINGTLTLIDGLTLDESKQAENNEMSVVFCNGNLIKTNLSEIRKRLL